jgi:hypothetical protein
MKAALAVLALAAGLATPSAPHAQRIDPPAAPGSLAPALARVGDSLALTWLERTGPKPAHRVRIGSYALRFSRLERGTWTSPTTIASSDDFFANWADVPAVADEGGGRLLAHWTIQTAHDTYAIGLARSEDGGKSWRRLASPSAAGVLEQSFVSLLPEKGAVRAAWLEKRAGSGSMTLRTALVRATMGESELLDSRVCDCCQLSTAMTSEGAVVAYRDRSEEEIRDIALVRRTTKGWSAPARVASDGWKIPGCPVNGPAVAATGRSVAVVWFTAAAEKPRVELAFSSDAGATFGRPVLVDGAKPLGRVAVTLSENGDAIVVWAATEGTSPTIRLRRVSPSGRLGEAVVVAPTTHARTIGLPSLARAGDSVAVAWVEPAEPTLLRVALQPAGVR